MSRLDDPGFDWTAVITLLVVFAVVVSGAGGGTYAVLSDVENTTGTLSVEQVVQNNQYQVYNVSCDAVDGNNVVETSPDADEMRSIRDFEVPERDGCAKVSVWLRPSAFDGSSPKDATIAHRHDGEWKHLNTSVEWQTEGWMIHLSAYTESFSPFAVFVPNESQPTQLNGSAVGVNTTSSNGTTPTATPTPTPTATPTPTPTATPEPTATPTPTEEQDTDDDSRPRGGASGADSDTSPDEPTDDANGPSDDSTDGGDSTDDGSEN